MTSFYEADNENNSNHSSNHLHHRLVPNFGILLKVLTDNGPQFTSKFFQEIFEELGVKPLTTTECRPETNGQVERFNATIILRLCHYIAKHQQDWDSHVVTPT